MAVVIDKWLLFGDGRKLGFDCIQITNMSNAKV